MDKPTYELYDYLVSQVEKRGDIMMIDTQMISNTMSNCARTMKYEKAFNHSIELYAIILHYYNINHSGRIYGELPHGCKLMSKDSGGVIVYIGSLPISLQRIIQVYIEEMSYDD